MKKTILLSAVLAAGAALATTVESGNAVGALDVELDSNKSTLIAVPFVGYGDAVAVKVEEMVKTSDLAQDSKLYVPDGEGNYNVWTLNSEGKWVAADNVLIDNKGDSTVKSSAPANAVTVKRGDSFWLEPIFKTGTKGTIFLLGQGDATQGSSAITRDVWNLIGNTAGEAKVLTATDFNDEEKVSVPKDGKLVTYTVRSGKWLNGRTQMDTISIAIGQGFWFFSKGKTTISW